MRQRTSLLAAMILAVPVVAFAGGCSAEVTPQSPATEQRTERPALGLMTTLPILWAEGDDFGAMLSADAETHWALDVLRDDHDVGAVDLLTPQALAPLRLLVLAQPRMLSAEENVALDDWVRGGGHVLIFADPMLTGHSRYGIGDKRRPQEVVLLDTILARWGLVLEPPAPRAEIGPAFLGNGALPLESAGWFARRPPAGGAQATCSDRLGRTLVICAIGEGRAVLLADATLLEVHENPEKSTVAALQELLLIAGGASGGSPAQKHGMSGE